MMQKKNDRFYAIVGQAHEALNDPDSLRRMNAQSEKARREFKIKNHNSQIAAAKVVLTA